MSEVIFNDKNICPFVDFRKKASVFRFIFIYRGKMSHAIVKNLLAMAEKKIDLLEEESYLKKKIYGIMVNCLQTICAEEKTVNANNDSIFLISKNAQGFTVYTGRYLSKTILEKLKEVIDNINSLKHESLTDLHKERLKELEISSQFFNVDETMVSLIDIAKKSKQKINYLIESVSDEQFFFSIQVQIN